MGPKLAICHQSPILQRIGSIVMDETGSSSAATTVTNRTLLFFRTIVLIFRYGCQWHIIQIMAQSQPNPLRYQWLLVMRPVRTKTPR